MAAIGAPQPTRESDWMSPYLGDRSRSGRIVRTALRAPFALLRLVLGNSEVRWEAAIRLSVRCLKTGSVACLTCGMLELNR